jgi:amidase
LKLKYRDNARQIVDKAFEDNDVDLIICPGDSGLAILSSACGYPVGTVPLGQLEFVTGETREKRRPFGMVFIGKAFDDAKLVRFMKGWEAISDPRPVPKLSDTHVQA